MSFEIDHAPKLDEYGKKGIHDLCGMIYQLLKADDKKREREQAARKVAGVTKKNNKRKAGR